MASAIAKWFWWSLLSCLSVARGTYIVSLVCALMPSNSVFIFYVKLAEVNTPLCCRMFPLVCYVPGVSLAIAPGGNWALLPMLVIMVFELVM